MTDEQSWRDVPVPPRIAARLARYALAKQDADAAYEAALALTTAALDLADEDVLGAVLLPGGGVVVRVAARPRVGDDAAPPGD